MHPVFYLLLLAAILYGSAVLYLMVRQPKMVFYPKRDFVNLPTDEGLAYEDVYFRSEDNLRLHGWRLGKKEFPGAPLILICHGNGGNISHRMDLLKLLHRLSLQMFIFDYRGYGKSEGLPSENGTYQDAAAAWRYLTETEKIPPTGIFLMGRSLGGAVATHLAAVDGINAAGLILESTFTSIPDVGAKMYPFLPVRTLSRFQYHTLALMPRIAMPLLVIHSPQDRMIPIEQGRKIFEHAVCKKEFLQISGSHDEGFLTSGETYSNGLKRFIQTSCKEINTPYG